MAEKKRGSEDSRKAAALRQHGSLNPRPEGVGNDLFRTYDFFDPNDLVQVKYEMLRQVSVERGSVTEAAAQFGLSRPSFYEAQTAFQQDGLVGLLPEKRGPRRAHKLSAEIMEFLQKEKEEDPDLSGAALAERLWKELDPDRQVQESIRLVFSLFRRTGSAYALVRHFRDKGLLFPSRPLFGPNRHELIWVPLQRSTIMRVLNNPRYAGAYFFGRTRGRRRQEGGRPISSKPVPKEQWHALIQDAHPGYIEWETYEGNLKRLEENCRAHPIHLKVPPREGPALLQGMAICGNCGRRMAIRYHWRGTELIPDYLCQYHTVEKLEKACMSIPGANVDTAVSALLMEAVTPVALEVSLAVQQELLSRLEEVDQLRLKQVERARYEANLAQRRYMQVEPENRLVADTLEAEWNRKLQALAEARLEYERQHSLDRQLLDREKREKIMALVSDFPRIWNDPGTPVREKKRLVALMIEDVTLTRGTEITMHVRFKGGLTRTLNVPIALNAWKKYMTAPAVLAEIDRLLGEHTDAEVARVLNERGLASGRRMKFTGQIIGALRKGNRLKSRYERLRERGMLDVTEMAALLGTSMRTVYIWHRQGQLQPHRYNDSGAYLYEAPEADSPLRSQDRKYRRGKTANQLIHSTNNEVQYEA